MCPKDHHKRKELKFENSDSAKDFSSYNTLNIRLFINLNSILTKWQTIIENQR